MAMPGATTSSWGPRLENSAISGSGHTSSLHDAPTEMTLGSVSGPGPTVFSSGPAFPAEKTTAIPERAAARAIRTIGSTSESTS
jgi:hypothetical protein